LKDATVIEDQLTEKFISLTQPKFSRSSSSISPDLLFKFDLFLNSPKSGC